jgi:hypothetical protein
MSIINTAFCHVVRGHFILCVRIAHQSFMPVSVFSKRTMVIWGIIIVNQPKTQRSMSMPQPQDRGGRDRLSAVIHFLGDLLGDVIRSQAGLSAYESEEFVRSLSKELRHQPSPERIRDLQRHIANLDVAGLKNILKAFSTYFALVNLSEQLQRIWVLDERDRTARLNGSSRSESLGEAIRLDDTSLHSPCLYGAPYRGPTSHHPRQIAPAGQRFERCCHRYVASR